jgi:hypothetical protein
LNPLYPRTICTKFDWIMFLWFWRRFFFKIHFLFTLLLLSPLRKGRSPLFEQTWIPSPKDDLCKVWLNLAGWFWRRSKKCKFTDRQTARQNGQQAIRIAHLSFQLRWAKNTMTNK